MGINDEEESDSSLILRGPSAPCGKEEAMKACPTLEAKVHCLVAGM